MVKVPGIINFDLLYPIFNTFVDKGEDLYRVIFSPRVIFALLHLKTVFAPS